MIGFSIVVIFVNVSVGVEYCKEWVSTADGQFRSHCYWYHNVLTAMSTFEADDECTLTVDGLAPYSDNKQYQFILGIRPSGCGMSFIGVMEVGKEGTWTNLDGTEIANNGFTSTFDRTTAQPNGGRGQNCAIINGCSFFDNRSTQDKECHSYVAHEMICYRNTLATKNCVSWISKTDGKRRSHCYWVASKYPYMNSFTVTEAMDMCRRQGGIVAPIIDDEQFVYVKNITDYYLTFYQNATIWTGTHNKDTRGQNWNRDPFNVLTNLVPLAPGGLIEEQCLTISGSNISWRESTTTNVISVVCYKISTSLVGSSNMAMEEIIQEITVDPHQTNAYRLSKMSVYEDRSTAKTLGYVGIAICAGPILFIMILDCIKLDNVPRKPTMKARNRSKRPHN